MNEKNNVFELFRRKDGTPRKRRQIQKLFFQLSFEEEQAFLSTVDAKGNRVEADHRMYSGAIREVLKMIETIQTRNHFIIDWANNSDQINLTHNEPLLWHLERCENFVDENLKPIQFVEKPIQLQLVIEEKEQLESHLEVHPHGLVLKEFQFINEEYLFANQKIYKTAPIGDNYSQLAAFETKLKEENLEKFLSIFHSYTENIVALYRDFQQKEGTKRRTTPALIFEKVDQDNSLFMRVSGTLAGFAPDFFDEYDLGKVVSINELEETIIVSEIDNEALYDLDTMVEKELRKQKRELKNGEGSNYFIDDNLYILEENLAPLFIQQTLPELMSRYAIFGAEHLKSYKIKPVHPKLNLSLGSGIDFLEGEAELDFDGETINLFDVLNQYKKNSYVLLNDGTHALINKNYLQKLERIFKKKKDKLNVSFFDLPIVEELIGEKVAEETFQKSREIFLGFNKLNKKRTTLPKVNATLRPYQKQGYKWLKYLNEHAIGGCLADDMGLGKTLQTLTLLSSVYPVETTPSLIVMPKSLLYNWEREIQKFNSELSYYIYYEKNRDLEVAMTRNLILTTYGMVRNDIEKLKEKPFHYIILDESQHIQNSNSQISRAVVLLQSNHRLALSGTPIQNNLGELYSLFRFLNPAMFGSPEDFTRNYLIPIQQEGERDVAEELRKKIYPFMLRRLKKEVLKDLPDKVEQTLYVEMSEKQKEFYEQRRRFFYQSVKNQIVEAGIKKSQFFILQAMMELRQIATIPESKSDGAILSQKRAMLMENLLDSIANGHKILVFANFLSVLDYVGQDLNREGINYALISGATKDREAEVQRFQNDPNCKVFLMTLKTGGVGLNLTAADTIFIFDPWWNKAAENQAIDRSHRIGQDKTVFSYKLITQGTIEEKILQLQEKKKELFEAVISSDGASLKSLDEQDIDFILG